MNDGPIIVTMELLLKMQERYGYFLLMCILRVLPTLND